jgi:hypothetical protein
MSIQLKIASLWIPDFILKKELDKAALLTIDALDNLLKRYAPLKMKEISTADYDPRGSLEDRRKSMAIAHNKRVKLLIEDLGYETAIEVTRKSMFHIGYHLGHKTRHKLGVGNDFKDLELAAKILYKILGIDFKIENINGNLFMKVNRCSLSKYYSPESCMVLSAADEGVVHGLNDNLEMKFKERITDGSSECIACIKGDLRGKT